MIDYKIFSMRCVEKQSFRIGWLQTRHNGIKLYQWQFASLISLKSMKM